MSDLGCVKENTVARLHRLLKFHPTDKICRVKPETAFVAAPFPCQNEFSSCWCKHSWGQRSRAFRVSRILPWAFTSTAKENGKQRFQTPVPAAGDCPKVLQKRKAISGAGLVPGFPGAGETQSPHRLFRSRAYLQGWALCSNSGLAWWHFHILQASPKIISDLWTNLFSKPTFYCLLGRIHSVGKKYCRHKPDEPGTERRENEKRRTNFLG